MKDTKRFQRSDSLLPVSSAKTQKIARSSVLSKVFSTPGRNCTFARGAAALCRHPIHRTYMHRFLKIRLTGFYEATTL